jgi:hypothetical protein
VDAEQLPASVASTTTTTTRTPHHTLTGARDAALVVSQTAAIEPAQLAEHLGIRRGTTNTCSSQAA